MASIGRQICEAWDFARNLEGSDEEISKAANKLEIVYAEKELNLRIKDV